MTDIQLIDHIDDILDFIAADIESAQTKSEQKVKSHGLKPDILTGDTAAQTHAALRHTDGFDIIEMVSEYRALRATICHLWAETKPVLTREDAADLERFHEAIDQALAESVVRFTEKVEKAKILLLGVLGHDIRSPVGAVQMATSLMPEFGPVNARQVKLLENIKISADRIQQIVNDLLDLAKSATGQSLPLRKKRFTLSSLCHQIVDETRLRHPTSLIEVRVPEDIEVCWDEIRLGQLIANLLSNAVQYGQADTPIILSVLTDRDEVVLTVSNHGAPIPHAHLETIFKSFSRGPRSAETTTSNLGLGLFIANEIASAHGGAITVVSNHSDGTIFSVRLPA
ncbi:MAG: HAMP domain-containing sensor histidine kinase [Asticcacaulis sp.]